MPAQTGKTITNLRLRAGPGVDHPTLAFLLPGTVLEILDDEGDWLRVVAGRRVGFVARRFVALEAAEEPSPLTPERDMEIEPEPDDQAASGSTVTTGYLNLREGPGIEHRVIRVLNPLTPVTIIGESGNWLKVNVEGQEGFVNRSFISLVGDLPQASPYIPFDSQIEEMEFEQFPILRRLTSTQKLVANTWNKYGGMLTKFATDIGVDAAILAGLSVGVVIQESGGHGFRNGKLLIRFENQLFFDHWGSRNRNKYDKHFRFNPQQRWLDHTFRPANQGRFRPFHGDQALEWQVFEFANNLDPVAAKYSISMGMPQILGVNHYPTGFGSVQQMFDVFKIDNQHQMNGFFTFVQNRPKLLKAIKEANFLDFAKLYNGPGQAMKYKELIEARIAEFQTLSAL